MSRKDKTVRVFFVRNINRSRPEKPANNSGNKIALIGGGYPGGRIHRENELRANSISKLDKALKPNVLLKVFPVIETFLDIQRSTGIRLITIKIMEFLMRVFRSFLSRMKMPAKHAKKRLMPA